MTETIEGHLYDYPKYYDLVFGSDWKAEFDFLLECFKKHAGRKVHKLFEPACGTGRLLIKLAQQGFDVSGNDLNAKAVEYCNQRMRKAGFDDVAVVGDMSNFRLKRKVDSAFNMINSFRHLETEKQAHGHMQCMADCLSKGGLYVLGLHLTPTVGDRIEEEAWSARRGHLQVNSFMWSKGIDLKKRREDLGMTFDVYTPTSHQRIEDEMMYRTYTAKQMQRLIEKVPEFEIEEVYDFGYDIDEPIEIDAETEDVVYVLKKT